MFILYCTLFTLQVLTVALISCFIFPRLMFEFTHVQIWTMVLDLLTESLTKSCSDASSWLGSSFNCILQMTVWTRDLCFVPVPFLWLPSTSLLQLATRSVHHQVFPLLTIHLVVMKGFDCQSVVLQTDSRTLLHLISSLEAALATLKTSSTRRVLRNIKWP